MEVCTGFVCVPSFEHGNPPISMMCTDTGDSKLSLRDAQDRFGLYMPGLRNFWLSPTEFWLGFAPHVYIGTNYGLIVLAARL